jgi:lysophospholipase L1-like esterase
MKKLIFIILSISIGVVFALLFSELFLRFNPKFGYIYNSFALSDIKTAPQTRYFAHNSYRPSSLLGYEHIPNSRTSDGLPINSYGLVGAEYKISKDKGVYRMLVLGDSIAVHAWACDFLEKQLNEDDLLGKRYKFELWNSGVGSYDVRRYALYFKSKGIKYDPDIVVMFLCMNDFELDLNIYYRDKNGAIAYNFPLSEVSKIYAPSPFLLRHSHLYRFVILRINSYLLSRKKAQGINKMEENGTYFMGMIKDICEQNGIPLLAVIFPYLKPLSEYNSWQLEEYNTIIRVAGDLMVPYIDLYQYFPPSRLHSLRHVGSGDDIHPNIEGHRIAAEAIYNYMTENLLKEGRSK